MPPALRTVGLYGAGFTRSDQFIAGLKHALPHTRLLWLDSGPLEPYVALCDAFIWLHDEARDCIPLALSTGKPVLGRSVPFVELGVPVVHMDDETPARLLAEQMVRAGAKRLLYWGMPRLFSQRRANGTRTAAQAAGIPFTECDSLVSVLAELCRPPHPCGLVCMNDERAHEVCRELHAAGIAVGSDALVSGFDNDPVPDAPWALPVSTVILPLSEQGRLAGSLLHAAATGTPIPLKVHLAPPAQVLHRLSTRGPQPLP